jgi:hypothetical protein
MIFGLGTCPRGQVPRPKPVNCSVYSLKITEMTEKDLNNWIMYHEIHKLNRMRFTASHIARFLGMDARTVRKYLKMTEAQYEQHLLRSDRKKVLAPYESFVAENLKEYPETSTAQIHDWLKEHHPDLPEVSPRTVFNFVMFIRQKYNIPYEPVTRSFFLSKSWLTGTRRRLILVSTICDVQTVNVKRFFSLPWCFLAAV